MQLCLKCDVSDAVCRDRNFSFKYLCPKVQANQHVIYCFHLRIQRAPPQLFFSNSVTNLEQEQRRICVKLVILVFNRRSSAFNILSWCICCVLLQQRSISIRRIFQKKPREVYTAQLEKVSLILYILSLQFCKFSCFKCSYFFVMRFCYIVCFARLTIKNTFLHSYIFLPFL